MVRQSILWIHIDPFNYVSVIHNVTLTLLQYHFTKRQLVSDIAYNIQIVDKLNEYARIFQNSNQYRLILRLFTNFKILLVCTRNVVCSYLIKLYQII